jgi:hypothetical protein
MSLAREEMLFLWRIKTLIGCEMEDLRELRSTLISFKLM